jgi:hypothetical protein
MFNGNQKKLGDIIQGIRTEEETLRVRKVAARERRETVARIREILVLTIASADPQEKADLRAEEIVLIAKLTKLGG